MCAFRIRVHHCAAKKVLACVAILISAGCEWAFENATVAVKKAEEVISNRRYHPHYLNAYHRGIRVHCEPIAPGTLNLLEALLSETERKVEKLNMKPRATRQGRRDRHNYPTARIHRCWHWTMLRIRTVSESGASLERPGGKYMTSPRKAGIETASDGLLARIYLGKHLPRDCDSFRSTG